MLYRAQTWSQKELKHAFFAGANAGDDHVSFRIRKGDRLNISMDALVGNVRYEAVVLGRYEVPMTMEIKEDTLPL